MASELDTLVKIGWIGGLQLGVRAFVAQEKHRLILIVSLYLCLAVQIRVNMTWRLYHLELFTPANFFHSATIIPGYDMALLIGAIVWWFLIIAVGRGYLSNFVPARVLLGCLLVITMIGNAYDLGGIIMAWGKLHPSVYWLYPLVISPTRSVVGMLLSLGGPVLMQICLEQLVRVKMAWRRRG